MLAKLLEKAPEGAPRREIAITKEEFLVGRGSDSDLRLSDSAISRHHCLLRIRAGEATISDLGSANGTFINNIRIRSQAAVLDGDVIGVGDFRFVLELQGGTGIDWGPKSGATPDMPTFRLKGSKSSPQ